MLNHMWGPFNFGYQITAAKDRQFWLYCTAIVAISQLVSFYQPFLSTTHFLSSLLSHSSTSQYPQFIYFLSSNHLWIFKLDSNTAPSVVMPLAIVKLFTFGYKHSITTFPTWLNFSSHVTHVLAWFFISVPMMPVIAFLATRHKRGSSGERKRAFPGKRFRVCVARVEGGFRNIVIEVSIRVVIIRVMVVVMMMVVIVLQIRGVVLVEITKS